MSLNIQLTPILKYLHQIRRIEDYVIFDMYFPNSWKILKKFVIEDKFVNMGTVDEGLIGMSFVSEANDDNLNLTQNNIIGIINYNLEREQKDMLLETKINELKGIFEKQSLDSLKSLKFDIKSNEINYKQNGKPKSIEVVGEIQEE
jgi:hypothetical protein